MHDISGEPVSGRFRPREINHDGIGDRAVFGTAANGWESLLSISELHKRRNRKWHQFDVGVLPAWIADMDFRVAASVQRAVVDLALDSDFGYPQRVAGESVEAVFAARVLEKFDWKVDASHVELVADLVQGVTAAVLSLSNRGDGVVVQTPLYPPLLDAVRNTGRRLIENPLVDDGERLAVDLVGLRAAAQAGAKVIILCNPHNPSGRVLERAELVRIGDIAIEFEMSIIADEIFADLLHDGRRHYPISSLDDRFARSTITLMSATKSFNLGGLRCGLIHFGSYELQKRFHQVIPDRLLGRISSVAMDATIAAWTGGNDWLSETMRQLNANRALIDDWVKTSDGVSWYAPEATYLGWLHFHEVINGHGLSERVVSGANVALSGGPEFGSGSDSHLRINFATSPDILNEILDRLGGALSSGRLSDDLIQPNRQPRK